MAISRPSDEDRCSVADGEHPAVDQSSRRSIRARDRRRYLWSLHRAVEFPVKNENRDESRNDVFRSSVMQKRGGDMRNRDVSYLSRQSAG